MQIDPLLLINDPQKLATLLDDETTKLNDLQSELANARNQLNKLTEKTEKERESQLTSFKKRLESLQQRIDTIDKHEEICVNVQACFDELKAFEDLPKSHSDIKETLIQHCTTKVLPYLLNEAELVLESIPYPALSDRQSTEKQFFTIANPSKQQKLLDIVDELVHLQVILSEFVDENNTLSIVDLLVNPFILRFKYHFYGTMHTNKLDQPEYFLTYLIRVIGEYSSFVEQLVQPVVSKYEKAVTNRFIDPLYDFLNRLIHEGKMKLISIIEPIHTLEDNSQRNQFSHTINEAIAFDQSVKASFHLADSIMDALLEMPLAIENWILLDTTNAKEAIEPSMMDWSCYDPENELKPSTFAYVLIQTIHSLNDRYRYTSLGLRHKLFDQVQVPLLKRIINIIKDNMDLHVGGIYEQSQEWIKYCSLINSAYYIEINLLDWSELDYMIEMIANNRDTKYDPLATECNLMISTMLSRLQNAIVDYFKMWIEHKYQKEDLRTYIDTLQLQLSTVQSNLESSRFNKLRMLVLTDLDRFLYPLISSQSGDSAQSFKRDISTIIHQVFDPMGNPIALMSKCKTLLLLK